jgi:prepilin signal peptidase PulO-like enzyme (type II secretory pathway)
MLLWKKISKDDLVVLTCGVAFLEIEWTFLLIAVSIKKKIILFIIKRNKQLSLAIRVVFHQDGAIPRNARMNFVFLNHLNHFGE